MSSILKKLAIIGLLTVVATSAKANTFNVEGNSTISAFQAVIDAANESKALNLTEKSEITCVMDASYAILQEEEVDSPNYCSGYLNEKSKKRVIKNVLKIARTKEDKVIANFVKEQLNSIKL